MKQRSHHYALLHMVNVLLRSMFGIPCSSAPLSHFCTAFAAGGCITSPIVCKRHLRRQERQNKITLLGYTTSNNQVNLPHEPEHSQLLSASSVQPVALPFMGDSYINAHIVEQLLKI